MTWFPWYGGNSIVMGFTGTKKGQTDAQLASVYRLLRVCRAAALTQGKSFWLLHGDCVGADAQAHSIAKELGFSVGIFPPINDKYRAWCTGADYMHATLEYLERDRLIAEQALGLIGTPFEFTEKFRGSGTWYTIRYARKLRHPAAPRFKKVNVVYPDGSIKTVTKT